MKTLQEIRDWHWKEYTRYCEREQVYLGRMNTAPNKDGYIHRSNRGLAQTQTKKASLHLEATKVLDAHLSGVNEQEAQLTSNA